LDFKISIVGYLNGDFFSIGSFFYSNSNQLIPNSVENLDDYIFTIGKSKSISWDSTQFGSESSVTIKSLLRFYKKKFQFLQNIT